MPPKKMDASYIIGPIYWFGGIVLAVVCAVCAVIAFVKGKRKRAVLLSIAVLLLLMLQYGCWLLALCSRYGI
jgi:hypothetical protein